MPSFQDETFRQRPMTQVCHLSRSLREPIEKDECQFERRTFMSVEVEASSQRVARLKNLSQLPKIVGEKRLRAPNGHRFRFSSSFSMTRFLFLSHTHVKPN